MTFFELIVKVADIAFPVAIIILLISDYLYKKHIQERYERHQKAIRTFINDISELNMRVKDLEYKLHVVNKRK